MQKSLKRLRHVTLALFCVSVVSCAQQQSDQTPGSNPGLVPSTQLAARLVGEWCNLTLDVDFNTGDTSAAARVVTDMYVDSASWEKILQIRPIRTTFRADSTWRSIYRNLNDETIRDVAGNWWIQGDTLVFRTVVPLPAPDERFHVVFDGDRVVFTGLIDFDQDGVADDLYRGTQRKVYPNQ